MGNQQYKHQKRRRDLEKAAKQKKKKERKEARLRGEDPDAPILEEGQTGEGQDPETGPEENPES